MPVSPVPVAFAAALKKEIAMSSRVLSTEQAKTAIRALQSTINGGFMTELSNLDKHAKTLSEPNNWDGPLAEQFRGTTWPAVNKALQNAKTQLDELHKELDKIASNIFTAGGGA